MSNQIMVCTTHQAAQMIYSWDVHDNVCPICKGINSHFIDPDEFMKLDDVAQASIHYSYVTTEKFWDYVGKFYEIPSKYPFSHQGLWPVGGVYESGVVYFQNPGDWCSKFSSDTESDFVVDMLPGPLTNREIMEILKRVHDVNANSSFNLYIESCHQYIKNLLNKYKEQYGIE